MDEFDFIERYFKPLSSGYSGSLNLTDDAAILTPPPGHDLVITKDAISQGVHFIGDESPDLIARKLLRVNMSDLAAMGAAPLCYFLAVMLPKNTNEEWFKSFARGLAEDQKLFGIHLAGGDTISTLGTVSLSLTAIGTVPTGKALLRSGAKVGDTIYVSGTLGDSALGLLSLRAERDEYLAERYLLPEPRLGLGQKLRGIASACMDISDGLVQDLGHLCKASGVGAVIHKHQLPLSPPAAKRIETNPALWEHVLAGGDDYELLFTAPADKHALMDSLNVTMIGSITEDKGVRVLDESGEEMSVVKKGFSHF